jgi:putative Mg2+ transporter-C (MgtC) family protein
MDLLEITLKLLLAVALGGMIGLERESSLKPAGFRTNVLICLSATMMMILSDLFFGTDPAPSGDRMRMAAAVITGIGFLGAGTIIQARGAITGLTTAATIWSVAGLGLVIGSGFYAVALILTLIIILTLILFRRLEERHLHKQSYAYTLKTRFGPETFNQVKHIALHEGIRLREITHRREGAFAVIQFNFPASEEREQAFSQSLTQMDEIVEIKIE